MRGLSILCLGTIAAAVLGCYAPPPTFGELPDFALTAVSAGSKPKPLTRADLSGRAWLADFVFTNCEGPCPALSNNMARLQKNLPKDVGLLTFTVDPDRDSPEILEAYARRFRADPARWLFVTGAKAPLLKLLIGGFKLPVVEDSGAPSGQRVTHSTRLVLIDAKGNIRGYFDGDDEVGFRAAARAARRL